MKIVVLDRLPLDPGDLDWSRIAALGELVMYDSTSPAETAARIRDADVVLTNKVRLTADTLATAPALRLASVLATGYDVVDVTAAKQRGITVCNVPAYSAAFTAQTAIALLMELTHHAGAHGDQVRAGDWSRSKTFSYWTSPLVQLAGKVAVIAGMGSIGRRVAGILSALDMRVIAAQLPGREASGASPYERLPLDEALTMADVLSLHMPLTSQTREIVNAALVARMKPTALIVNSSRGGLVNERDLADALLHGTISGYAADVLSTEPPAADNPLLTAPHCVITPHIGWAAPETRAALVNVAAGNIEAWLGGHPQNVVS
ncbi:MAG: D-2-hydroxyacid dehydrogenase [Capsulimonadaceae bacterium]|nr:D-2-hydroxyacid dehydrogenase [Capsulimonadaceae bacterium]